MKSHEIIIFTGKKQNKSSWKFPISRESNKYFKNYWSEIVFSLFLAFFRLFWSVVAEANFKIIFYISTNKPIYQLHTYLPSKKHKFNVSSFENKN